MSEFERQSLVYSELDVPRCALRYGQTTGEGTCPAVKGVDSEQECWNTRATCPVPLSFVDTTVTIRYGQSSAYRPKDIDCMPSLLSAEISPGTIKPGESLGERSTLTVVFQDGPHPDTGLGQYDFYRSERDYDPVAQGSYWGKFRARQQYLRGLPHRIKLGYVGQEFADFESRSFFLESFEGPTLTGTFTIQSKDIFKQLDGDRAVAPEMSEGYLLSDISSTAAELTLAPTGIGATYDDEGYVNLGGKEIVRYWRTGLDQYVKLLLHAEGADGSTTFTDSSASAHTVTAVGNAQIDTAQFKFGSSSILFDGTGDQVALDGSSDFAFGTGDFTIDFFIRRNASGEQILFDMRPPGGNGLYPLIYINSANALVYHTNSANRITQAGSVSTGVWHHIALTRANGVTRLWFNGGQSGGDYVDSNDYIVGASRPSIGGNGNNPAVSGFNGWMDEVRVSKGIARWTAVFTPPAAPAPLTTDVLTIPYRAQLNTEAQDHKAQDRVQTVLDIFGENVADIIRMLMVDYAGVPEAYIPIAEWLAETEGFLGTVCTAYIAEPTPVRKLVDELIEQQALCVWWDDRAELIRLTVLRAISTDAKLFDEHNMAGDAKLGVREQPDKRLSRVLTYYSQINPLKAVDDLDNYRSSQMTIDGESETNNGSSAIKVITSRWIPQNARAVAQKLNNKLLARFRNAPRMFSFATMRYSDNDVELGRGYNIGSPLFQGPDGARVNVPVQVVRLSPMRDRLVVEAEEMRFEQLDDDVDPGGHLVIIDTDSYNIDARALHDSQYDEAESGDIVTFQINAGVTVGSTSTAISALLIDSGWASGVTVRLINNGRIAGKGGAGGAGGFGAAGSPGSAGGTALKVEYPIDLDNSNGEIDGGAGGGGGGGANAFLPGGGGGGGCGQDPGLGAVNGYGAASGSAGTSTSGGSGGAGTSGGGNGGAGGDPGEAGSPGGAGTFGGGTGGAAGPAIDGISNVTDIGADPGTIWGSTIN